MSLKINTKSITEKHVYKDVIEDENGTKYPFELSLKDLRDAVSMTAAHGPVAGDSYLQEILAIDVELDAETLSTITSNALVQFYGSTPR